MPPGWDERYVTVFNSTFDEVGVEGLNSMRSKLRSAGMPIEELPGPPLLTVTSDGDVEGICWCLATRLVDGRTAPMIYFYYHDLMRCDAQGRWRFARRFLRLRFRDADHASHKP